MTDQKASDVFSIEKIRRAAERISGYVVRTPLLSSPMLDKAADAREWVKPEALQLTGSAER
jgi:threonine dehydratase